MKQYKPTRQRRNDNILRWRNHYWNRDGQPVGASLEEWELWKEWRAKGFDVMAGPHLEEPDEAT